MCCNWRFMTPLEKAGNDFGVWFIGHCDIVSRSLKCFISKTPEGNVIKLVELIYESGQTRM